MSMESTPAKVPLPFRLRVAVAIGIGSALICAGQLTKRNLLASDFTWPWHAAQVLLAGANPYLDPTIGPGHPYPFDAPFYYPLPAALVAIPFSPLPPIPAGALFFGLGAALLAFGITRDSLQRLPIFLSAPFWIAGLVAQWSPLVCAAAFFPLLWPLAVAKPNLLVPIAVARPSRKGILLVAVVLVLSVLVLPHWPLDWLANVTHQQRYPIPLLVLPGPLLLLAALRWRSPGVRLVLVATLVPQLLWFYDQLPLMLVARSARQSAVLAALSWVGFAGWRFANPALDMGPSIAAAAPWVITFVGLPALVCALMNAD